MALAGVIVVSPELMGGATPGALLAIVLLAIAAASSAVWLLSATSSGSFVVGRGVALAVTIALSLTILQAVPLPTAFSDRFSPDGVDARASIAALGIDAPSWWPLSASEIATRSQILVGLAIICAFSAATVLCSRGQREWIVRLGATSTLLVALVSLAHVALDLRAPFGMLSEPWWNTPLIGPLLNPNHLSGFVAMGVPLSLAAGLDARARPARIGWFVSGAISAGVVVVCASRGGIASLAIGVLTLAVLIFARRRALSRRVLLASLGGIAVLSMAALVGVALVLDWLRHELEGGSYEKLRLAARGLELALTHPWLGVGRGAFSAAFVRLFGTDERIDHPENIVVQWTSEWGLIVGIALLVTLATAWARGALAARSPAQTGALAAVASIAAHDLVDFALEMPGIAIVASAVLAAAIAPSARREEADDSVAISSRTLAALAGTAFVAVVALGPSIVSLDQRRLQNELLSALRRGDFETFDARIVDAVRAHPSEPVFTLLGAHAAARRGDERVALWLNQTMRLAPGWHEPHRIAARWLTRRGALEQAWLEVREVRDRLPTVAPRVGCDVLAASPDPSLAIRVFGHDMALLDALASCPGLPDEFVAQLDAALVASGLAGPRVRRARRAIAAGRPADALGELDGVAGTPTPSPQVAFVRAEALLALQRPSGAAEALEQLRAHGEAEQERLRRLAEARAAAGDADGMRDAVRDLVASASGAPARVAAARMLLARLERRMGNHGRALRALEEAHRADPSSSALDQIASLSDEVGDVARARRARMEICRRDGRTSAACAPPGVE
ncbi:O-antigen ligase family protein [Sandaracinus amylolyticus]|uniref:O-antigen ligase family protein n=1 Tax=Sandaracinus amylolyticus TaxID=927083 RepID=UPI0012ECCDF8|nr:O-antigen ligase family protein [Sandaracinus amylolyticus]